MISRASIFGALIGALIGLVFSEGVGQRQALAWENVIPGSRYTSVRAAALGGAFLPLGEDGAAALFYNPAAVGKIRSTQAEPMNLAVTSSGGLVSTLGLNSYKVYSLSANQAQLTAAPNTFQGAAAQLVPSFYGKGFALGMLISNDFGASADEGGNIRYRTQYQLIPAASVGLRLAGGIVRLGYNFQWVNQASGDVSVPAGTADLGYNQGLAEGSGFSHNFGAALTLPITYLPQLNLVIRNIGGTPYSTTSILPVASNPTGAPATEPMTFDTSFSLQPKIDNGIYANFVAQLRDLTARTGISALGRLSGGLEISFRDFLILRGGWGMGYPSAGLGFKVRRGEFGFAWYSEEIGGTYHGQRDVRYMFQFQLRAF